MSCCPTCERQLADDEAALKECPYCGATLSERDTPTEPDWGEFPGASLEFDSRAVEMAAEEFEFEADEEPVAEQDAAAAMDLDARDEPDDRADSGDRGEAETTSDPAADDHPDASPEGDVQQTLPLDEEPPPSGEPDFRMFASLEIDEEMLPVVDDSSSGRTAATPGDEVDYHGSVADDAPPRDEDLNATADAPAAEAIQQTPADSAESTERVKLSQTIEMAAAVPGEEEAPPTTDEKRTLDDVWHDASGSRPEVTIKSMTGEVDSTGGSANLSDSVLLSDTFELLPHRRVRSAGDETIEHPEYELVRVLGEGGMGVVWDARQTSVDRSVAVKMIRGPYARKPKQRRKFLAEAVVTGDLDHPNIVPVYDVGRDAGGRLFYSMKHVQGTPWQDVLPANSVHENLQILLRVADAVAFAHSRGIIHRDVKPENVMLGEYGETLLMDWGLSLPTEEYRKSGTLEFSRGMGGTPAYMAPEMASGPVESISKSSDVYLLGAILYEIVTGRPPHPGRTVKSCLLSAMRNRITPTDQEGELVEIAMKAMSTDPVDRHASVQEFQLALREYLSHAESISLASRAQVDLKCATESGDYRDYARAVFAYEEAFELWNGNREAESGIMQARLAYARAARRKGDFDLGLSLLDRSRPEHRGLYRQLTAARDERQSRQQRLKIARRVTMTMAGVMFLVVTGAFLRVSRALQNETIALRAKQGALEEADRQRREAERAVYQQKKAKKERQYALTRAEDAQREAVAARNQAEYKAYVAGIGAAAAKIDEGAFDVALEILVSLPSEFRNWEWGRLVHLCHLYSQSFGDSGPVDSLAVSPDGTKFIAGSWDNTARIRDVETGAVLAELPHQGLYVHAVAWSPDGTQIATGGSDPNGHYLRLWDAATAVAGQQVSATIVSSGHSEPVVSVRFSPDGRWLLSCSYDNTARLWDVSSRQSPLEVFVFAAHNWWVWDGAFAPGFAPDDAQADNRIVTVDQDGKAIVWRMAAAEGESEQADAPDSTMSFRQDRVFEEHVGPVYSVDFATVQGEEWIVTGGHDNRVLAWRPEDVEPFGLDSVFGTTTTQPQYREFSGHVNSVQSVAFSRDGELIVSAGRDNTVWIWSAVNDRRKIRLRGHYNEVRDAVFTPDGRHVVSAGLDEQVLVWSTDHHEEFRVLQGHRVPGHDDAVLSAQFSGDGSRIVTASRDRTARIWDAETVRLLAELREGHDFLVSSAVIYRDGTRLVTASADDTTRIWDIARGTELLQIPGTGRSGIIALSQDERWIVTGGSGNIAQLWELNALYANPRDYQPRILQEHHGTVTAVACSPTQDVAATGDINGRTSLWDMESGELLWSHRHQSRRINAIAFMPDGTQVLSASSDHTVTRLGTISGERLDHLPVEEPVTALAVSDDGRWILTVSEGEIVNEERVSRVVVWDAIRTEAVTNYNALSYAVNSVSLDRNGRRALLACDDDALRFLPLQDAVESPETAEPFLRVPTSGSALVGAALSEDGSTVVTLSGSDAMLFDARTGELLMTFRPHAAVASAQFAPLDETRPTRVVTGSWDQSAKIWDPESQQALVKFDRIHDGFVNSVVFSPDGSRILTAGNDGYARIWDVETRQLLVEFEGHTGPVRSAVYSPDPDGSMVLTVSNDRTARLWDATAGDPLGEPFLGHEWPVLCGAFSADGKKLITGSEDNEARVWSIADHDTIAILIGHTAPVSSVAFSRDGLRAFTASRDTTAKIWDVSAIGLQMSTEGIAPDLLTLTGHERELTSISVSPDGHDLLTASRDGTAMVWNASVWKQATSPAVTARVAISAFTE